MPIYEFKCKSCGEEFELLLKSRDEVDSVKCPKCGSKEVSRLMSVVNSIIGGSSSGGDKPRVVESHTCPTGTCTHVELPGYER